MNDDFKRYYLGEWPKDPEFELYLEAWMAYHEATNLVDGHLPPWDMTMNRKAVEAGNRALDQVLNQANHERPDCNDLKWRKAKIVALDRQPRYPTVLVVPPEE